MYKIILLTFFMAAFSFAQTVTVKDTDSKIPLELVTVYSTDINRALTTNSKGKVDISPLKNSKQISFKLLGYEKIALSFSELSQNNYEVFLKEAPIAIGNVVVSANRWDEDRSDVPNTIEYISPKDVELQNPQTTADMLSQSGFVFVQKSQLGGGSPMIRGFATNRVLIVVDNVRMNNAIFRSGNLQNVISLDANSLANTQIIFGPGSVIYGSDALGGVMNFNTLDPQFSYGNGLLFNGSAMTRYSSANNEKTGHIQFSFGLEKWGFLTSATYSDFSDLQMGSNGPDDYLRPVYQDKINGIDTAIVNPDPELQKLSAYNQLNIMQKIRFKPNEDWEFNYGFHYSTTSDVPRYDRLIELSKGIPKSAQWYYGPQNWMMSSLSITSFDPNFIADLSKLIVAYQTFEESRHDRKFGKNTLNHRTEKLNAISANLDFIKKINDASQIYYGVEAIHNKVESAGEEENIKTHKRTSISSRYPDGSVWNSFGAYLTYKNNLSEDYLLQTGLRYSLINLSAKFDRTFFSFPFTTADLTTGAITGTAGLVWHPQKDWQINLNLSTGFRAPNIDDIGKIFDSEPGAVIVPNPNLKSEYVYSAELGLWKLFTDKLKLEVIGFYSYLDDALVRRNFKFNGLDSIVYDGTISRVDAIQNAAFAYIYGFHAGFDLKIIENLKLSSKFTYQKGEEEDDNGDKTPLRHAAPYYGNTQLVYERERFNFSLYAEFNGEVSYENLAPSEQEKPAIYAKDNNGNPYSPAWLTLNFKGGVKLNENILLNVGVENITDQRYRPYSSGITAAGRNFIASVKYNL